MKKRNVNIKPAPIKDGGGCCGPKPTLQVEENKSPTSCCGPKTKEVAEVKSTTSGCCG